MKTRENSSSIRINAGSGLRPEKKKFFSWAPRIRKRKTNPGVLQHHDKETSKHHLHEVSQRPRRQKRKGKPRARRPLRKPSTKHFLSARATTKIATLNVHSLCSAAKLDKLAKLAQDYKLDIIALTDVHRTGKGVIPVTHPDIKGKYYLLYSGHEERTEQGVGLLLSARAYHSFADDWSAISPRLLRTRFRSPQARVILIVAYAPTLPCDEANSTSHWTHC